jgi:hypothetical protein
MAALLANPTSQGWASSFSARREPGYEQETNSPRTFGDILGTDNEQPTNKVFTACSKEKPGAPS